MQARQPRQVTLWNPGADQVRCTLAATEGKVREIGRRNGILAAPCLLAILAGRILEIKLAEHQASIEGRPQMQP